MSDYYSIISRRLLKGAGAIWLLSISHIGFTVVSQILAVRICPSLTYTRITLESSRALKYRQFTLSNPKRVVVDIEDININSVLKRMNAQICDNDHYIKFIRVKQFNPKTVRIVFELKQNVKLRLFALAPIAGFKERLFIDLCSINVTDDIQDLLLVFLENYKQSNSLGEQISLSQNESKINKIRHDRPIIIMLDPGHGGEDSGAIGKYSTREKDVVLQIAQRLKRLIERESNMRAYMTRNEDIFIPLNIRVLKAQKQHADLFISIHANAFINRQSSGSSVFALSNEEATNTAASYLENMQNTFNLINGVVSKSGDRYVDHTMLDMVQSLTIIDSLKFGKAVLNKISNINKLHKNNVEQASFAVLKAPDIPSILIETAFISNVEEEKKLKTAKFHQEIAESILAGIKEYFSEEVTLARLS